MGSSNSFDLKDSKNNSYDLNGIYRKRTSEENFAIESDESILKLDKPLLAMNKIAAQNRNDLINNQNLNEFNDDKHKDDDDDNNFNNLNHEKDVSIEQHDSLNSSNLDEACYLN